MIQIMKLIESENKQDYQKGLHDFQQQKQNSLIDENLHLISEQFIPKILFTLNNFNTQTNDSITQHLQIITYFVYYEDLVKSLIENGFIQILLQLVFLQDKSIGKNVLDIFYMTIRMNSQFSNKIQTSIINSFSIQQVMEIIKYQSYQTSSINKVVILYDIKSFYQYQKKSYFIQELINILEKENKQSEQFIKALEIISEWIQIKQVQKALIAQVGLQKLYSTIPIWLERYRSALDSILIIFQALIQQKSEQKLRIFILKQGLQKYLIQLIQSKIFCVRDLTFQIIQEFQKDEICLELLFQFKIMQELLDQLKQRPNQNRIIQIFIRALPNSNNKMDKLYVQNKNIFQQFIQLMQEESIEVYDHIMQKIGQEL